jgi:dolichyl-diphosphooligosaccharide--protein glycosyltransferase
MSIASKGLRKVKRFLAEKISKETFISRLRGAEKFLSSIPKGSIIHFTCLFTVLIIAILVRLMPLRWGFYLSEFDPFFQYRVADYVVKNGFAAWFNWHDDMSWYPWGRDIPKSSFSGLPFTAAALFMALNALGLSLSLYHFCVIFPVLMGAITCIALYFLGKDVWGRSVGLISALFLALNASHISRTSLGFFDDENTGVLAMVLFFIFYLRSISPEKSVSSRLLYASLAGLSLFYLSISWGAFRYPLDLIVLFSFALILLHRYSRRLLVSYGVTYGLALFAASQFPRPGFAFLKEWSTLAVFAVFLIFPICELLAYVKKLRSRVVAVSCFVGLLILGAVFLWQLGFIASPGAKYMSVLTPSTRLEMPLIESVAEHRPATWAALFHEFGVLTFLGVFGFYFVSQRFRDLDIFLIIFGLSSLYFAGSMVRLTLILAPAFCILAAITVVELVKPSVDILRESVIFSRRKVRYIARVGKEFGVAILLILVIAIMPTFSRAVKSAYSPATIVTSSLPALPQAGEEQRYQDWLEALIWMRENLPSNAVVCSWWDYGYWITAVAGKHTLADNGTLNSTQIRKIAEMFLSNETRAITILREYNATHVVIFVTGVLEQKGINFSGHGEDSKWYWMAKIAGLNETALRDEERYNKQYVGSYVPKDSTVLGRMIWGGVAPNIGKTPENFELVFSSSNRFVLVYEVKYPNPTAISCSLSNSTITYGQPVEISGRITGPALEGIGNVTVHLEYSADGGGTWKNMTDVETLLNGTYFYTWLPDAGSYLIRAKWDGIAKKYFGAKSENQPLKVNKAAVSIACRLSSNTIVYGQNVTILCNVTPSLSGGTVRFEYSSDNVTWTLISSGVLLEGEYSTVWSPPSAGTFYVRAFWTGDRNHSGAISLAQTLIVKGK